MREQTEVKGVDVLGREVLDSERFRAHFTHV